MPSPNAIIDEIVGTTLENRSKDIADNITQSNAALSQMSKRGNVEFADGGSEIREHFNFQENGNANSYSGFELLSTAQTQDVSGAQFSWAQYSVQVAMSGADIAKNSGDNMLISLIKAKVDAAESSIKNRINRDMYLDGTGNNGKNLTGLAAAVSLTPTTGTYGGIDRSVNTFWHNKKYVGSTDGGVATATTLFGMWSNFYTKLVRGTDKPTIILCGPTLYNLYQSTLVQNARYTDTDTANAGFENVTFMGIPVVLENSANSIGTNDAYFLNSKFLKWRPHSDRNFVMLDDKSPVNQDAVVKTLVFMGNMTCSGAQFQGVFRNA